MSLMAPELYLKLHSLLCAIQVSASSSTTRNHRTENAWLSGTGEEEGHRSSSGDLPKVTQLLWVDYVQVGALSVYDTIVSPSRCPAESSQSKLSEKEGDSEGRRETQRVDMELLMARSGSVLCCHSDLDKQTEVGRT
jgi:hypothetical protein